MEEKNERKEFDPHEPEVLPEELDNDSLEELELTPPEEVDVSSTGAIEVDDSLIDKITKKKTRRRWIGAFLLVSLLIVGLAIWLGYRNGVQRRLNNERTLLMDQISLQLELAYKDIADENYENAKIRLEYIIEKYPDFPGASDLLVDVLMHMDAPTPVPTAAVVLETEVPEITPIPDTRAAEEVFGQIEQNIANEEWSQAVENIETLRETNYEFKSVEVDGFYFIAMRNRGIQRIWAGELEQGMYDLSVVGHLGAIDNVAAGAISWASLYMTGASYWDVNWAGAVEIFSQLYEQMPFFSDSSGMTTSERYRVALYRLGDQFAASGDYCSASSYYQRSLAVGVNLDIQVTATWLAETCANPPGEDTTPEPLPDPDATPTPEPELPPTETPDPEP